MITLPSRILATTVASLMLAGAAFAQTAAPAAPAASATKAEPAKTAPAKMGAPKEKAERSAASLECSKQADAKGLHGKERKKFRSECKKTAGKPN
ncbi:MAG: phosphate starvation-inducible protein PsiF [Candidatus Afipia apatlaquensis]|uniref:Phosphate starvation-inducible protein PsiF n=1 Tax=Candidatus Afipia apatlaquensis TaxID=2712852 RepID=A0A7C9RFG4_9BRAD|nr:phosphate starvation-inducible protein PsiF [Candidatus Afipia apatlaquensis]